MIRTTRVLALLLATTIAAPGSAAPQPAPPIIIDDLSVCFAPEMDCANFIAEKIGKATTTLTVAAYNFTERRIVDAIIGAHQRGVAVTVKLDKISPCQKGAGAAALLNAGVPTFIDNKVKIA